MCSRRRGVYPYAARRPYAPAPGTGLDAYRRMLGAIGFARAVLVIPTSMDLTIARPPTRSPPWRAPSEGSR